MLLPFIACFRWENPSSKKIEVNNWMKEFIHRVAIEKGTQDILAGMSEKFYTVIELNDSDLEYVNDFVTSSTYSYYYVVDYLIRLCDSEK